MWWYILAIVILLIALVLIGGSYYAYRQAFFNPIKNRDIYYPLSQDPLLKQQYDDFVPVIDTNAKLPYERVFVTSDDGLRLSARLYINDESKPIHVLCHGYKGSGLRDMSGGLRMALDLGHNALLIDQRAHGLSEGKTISFGILERYDVLSWVEYLERRYPTMPVALCGVSMGGATVLMCGDLPLPPTVKCIMADCPYSSVDSILKSECASRKLNPTLVYPLLKIGARLYGRFGIESASPLKSAPLTHLPTVIVHGEDDELVPVDMSKKIAELSDNITLHTFPRAGHGTSYIVDTPRYEQIYRDFVAKYLH
ncbi:MAG: alpha/beta hydrolase [Clostridia bacterium]|nr:alpha/beta hydrolase [Clostridia bacterium]